MRRANNFFEQSCIAQQRLAEVLQLAAAMGATIIHDSVIFEGEDSGEKTLAFHKVSEAIWRGNVHEA